MGRALFIDCYGRMSMDILTGGMLDMGVPEPYLLEEMKKAGATEPLLKKFSKTRIKATYFHIPSVLSTAVALHAEDLAQRWNDLCSRGEKNWTDKGQKIFQILAEQAAAASGADAETADLTSVGVTMQETDSLYAFFSCLEYLDIDSVYCCPLHMAAQKNAREVCTAALLNEADTLGGKEVAPGLIDPFAAAVICSLTAAFLPVDSRFLTDRTSYGTSGSMQPDSGNTAAFYCGYFVEKPTLFNRRIKVL